MIDLVFDLCVAAIDTFQKSAANDLLESDDLEGLR